MYVRDRVTAYMVALGYTLRQRGTVYYYLHRDRLDWIDESVKSASCAEHMDKAYNMMLMSFSKVVINITNSRLEFMKMDFPGYDYNIDFLDEVLGVPAPLTAAA